MKTTAPPLKGLDETDLPTQQQTTQANARIPRSHGYPGRPPGVEEATCERAEAADGDHSAEAAGLGHTRVERFPKTARVRKRAEYLRIQRVGRRTIGPCFIVISALAGSGMSRVGITVSRRVGDAVTRNRIKRLVREFFRRHRRRIKPPQTVVVIGRSAAADATYATVQHELSRTLKVDVTA